MLLPETQVTLIESNQKKSTFLKEVVFALKLKSVSVFYGRGEDYRQRADLVTMRAVEKFEEALSIAVGLVEQKGRIALMIGAPQAAAARNMAKEVEWGAQVAIPGSHSGILLLGTKAVKVEPH
jgi:16S rRNA (guanine527-N7)-methyltransferase